MMQRLLSWLGRRQTARYRVDETIAVAAARMDRASEIVCGPSHASGVRLRVDYRTINRTAFGREPYDVRRQDREGRQ